MGCIYSATNTINGRIYIGKTIRSMTTRRTWHCNTALRGEGFRFHNALRRYGIEAFEWNILFTSDNYEELNATEKRFISEMQTRSPNGYNLTDGGDGLSGMADESKAKVIAFHTGRKRSDETKRRISESAKGKQKRLGAVLSEETKLKISRSNSGFKHTDESKRKIAHAMKGIPKTLEQRAKMSEARKQWWLKQ